MGLTPEATSSGRGRAGGSRHRILAVVLVITAFLLLDLMSQEPVISGLFLLAFTGAGMAGVLWWGGREATRTMRRRTRLVIAKILSDGRPRNREEPVHEVRRRVVPLRHAALRWLRIEDRAQGPRQSSSPIFPRNATQRGSLWSGRNRGLAFI